MFSRQVIKQSFSLLSKNNKKRIVLAALLQSALGILDLIGVVIIGALGALAIQGIQSQSPGNKVSILLDLVRGSSLSLQGAILYLGILAALIFSLKTFLSILITRRTFFFMSNLAANISAELFSRYLSQNLTQIQKHNSQAVLYFVSEGIRNIIIGILGTAITLVADFSLLVILLIGLFLVDIQMTLLTFILFLAIAFVLHIILRVRAHKIGLESYQLSVQNNKLILEVLGTFKELFVKNKISFYISSLTKIRTQIGRTNAELAFQPYISKYVIELGSVIGAVFLCAYQFWKNDAVYAVSVLSVFLIASSRIAPAVMRMQQSFTVISNSTGASKETFALLHELELSEQLEYFSETKSHSGFFDPRIEVKNLNFTYDDNDYFALRNINLILEAGKSLAIVGPSGSGKSTLVDLILGVLQPDSGSVTISNSSPVDAIHKWPGGIAYVPQETVIVSGTIKENVALGYEKNEIKDELIWNALAISQLSEVVMELDDKLDSFVGENGFQLSGGQRQRLGLARALYSEPRILILDEATSSLDGVTEDNVAKEIAKLKGEVTLVIIAHRLSTVRSVDKLIYLENGEIKAAGTFEEVKKQAMNFSTQAKLMGL